MRTPTRTTTKTTKRTSRMKTGAIKAVKAGGLALALLAGAPTSGSFAPAGQGTGLAAQGVRGVEGIEGFWFIKWCDGPCPGRGAYCCGYAV